LDHGVQPAHQPLNRKLCKPLFLEHANPPHPLGNLHNLADPLRRKPNPPVKLRTDWSPRPGLALSERKLVAIAPRGPLASTNKSLAQINKSPDVGKATTVWAILPDEKENVGMVKLYTAQIFEAALNPPAEAVSAPNPLRIFFPSPARASGRGGGR
jgi:hypothetical protein